MNNAQATPASTLLPWVSIGCISAFLSVIMGAFGAHALAQRLSERMLEVFKTGAQYQMYHSLALIAFGLWSAQAGSTTHNTLANGPGWAFLAGLVLFSGSLYALAVSGVTWLGAITPLGGLSFMLGWALFSWQAWHR